MSGLVEVLAAHYLTSWDANTEQWRTDMYCICGDRIGPSWTETEGPEFRAHVAAAVEAWLAERLASDEVREAVTAALRTGAHLRSLFAEDADAALAAITAALTQGDRR